MKKLLAIGALCVVMALMPLAVACGTGTHDAPSLETLQKDSRIVEFRLSDGRSLTCLFYSSDGVSGYQGYSWLVLDCDWESLKLK